MRSEEIKGIFDQQASSYDERWAETAPIREGLHFLLEAVFAEPVLFYQAGLIQAWFSKHASGNAA